MATSDTVSVPMWNTRSASVRMAAMLRPEMTAPLGSPVVPEVYSWSTASSGSGSKPGSSSLTPSASRHAEKSSRATQ